MNINIIDNENLENALNLVMKIFLEYEAPDYSTKGIETFKNSVILNQEYLSTLTFYGAYQNSNLLGVIATRNNGSHIALFFVDGAYHGQGIGRSLLNTVLENSPSNEMTVNSSPFAISIYHHFGFIDTDTEQITDGIKYTPMKLILN